MARKNGSHLALELTAEGGEARMKRAGRPINKGSTGCADEQTGVECKIEALVHTFLRTWSKPGDCSMSRES